jgi:hypothetical protein
MTNAALARTDPDRLLDVSEVAHLLGMVSPSPIPAAAAGEQEGTA